jgi:hypothetical protein
MQKIELFYNPPRRQGTSCFDYISAHVPGRRKDYTQALDAGSFPKRNFVEDCRGQGVDRMLGFVEHTRVSVLLDDPRRQQGNGVQALAHGFGVSCLAERHQSSRVASSSHGTQHVMRSWESTSCHTCRKKGQAMTRWCIVSGC